MAQNSPLSTPISNVFCGSTRAKTNASKARSRRLHHTSSAVRQIAKQTSPKPAVDVYFLHHLQLDALQNKRLQSPLSASASYVFYGSTHYKTNASEARCRLRRH